MTFYKVGTFLWCDYECCATVQFSNYMLVMACSVVYAEMAKGGCTGAIYYSRRG